MAKLNGGQTVTVLNEPQRGGTLSVKDAQRVLHRETVDGTRCHQGRKRGLIE